MTLFRTKPRPALSDEALIRCREDRERTWGHMQRIAKAVEDAGYDPEMLHQLPTGHIIAALLLGVK